MKTLIALILLVPSLVFAQQRLVMIGGGPRPVEAMKQIGEWAGGKKGVVLFATWPSAKYPGELGKELSAELEDFVGTDISLHPPTTVEEKEKFLDQFSRAKGIFFSGGDQNRIAKVLETYPDVREAFERAYERGVVFGGTSAGTAIMSETIIREGGRLIPVELGRGLGFFNSPGAGRTATVVVDQHFSQREWRRARLLKAMKLAHVDLGVGIDEGTALIVKDRKAVDVIGAGAVRVFRADESERMLRSGEHFQLPAMCQSLFY